ncbi:MAG: PEP-CTERM sorting domain-containing protein [Gemmatales bacterium]|nr:PEP-CTERM sorting domain-containing protein [Gemmatales bacterium]MDW8387743.1 PEP-CTERM sorting domain-containing protein [Gemmatales bacterium]
MRLFGPRLTLFAFSFLLFSLRAEATPLIIDTFNSPTPGHVASGPIPPSIPGDPFPQTFGPDLGIGAFGATRTVSFTGTSSGGAIMGLGDTFALNVTGSLGQLSMFTGTSQVEATLTYTFPSPVSFAGFAGIEMDVAFYDEGLGGSDDWLIQIVTGSGTLTYLLSPAPFGTNFTLFFPFSLFSGTGDLSNVSSLIISINNGGSPGAGTDFVINEIRLPIVPEPGTLALFGVGLLGVVGITLRRRFASPAKSPVC